MLASGEINVEEHSVAKRRLLDAFVQRNTLRSAAVELQNLQRQNLITVVEQAGCLQRLISGDHEKHALLVIIHPPPAVPIADVSGIPPPSSPGQAGAQSASAVIPPLCINGSRSAQELATPARGQGTASELGATMSDNTPLLGAARSSSGGAQADGSSSSTNSSPQASPGQRQGQAATRGQGADDGASTSGSMRSAGRRRSGVSDVMLSPQLKGVVDHKRGDEKIEADVMCEGTLSWPSGWFSRWAPCYAILFRSGMLYLFSMDPQTRTVQRGGDRTRLWLGRATIKAARETTSIILECFPTDGASGPSTKTLLKAPTVEAWEQWLNGLKTVVERSRAERALVYLRVASYISPEEKVNRLSN
eukprot:jgi/Mesvir1/16809/Mv15173-RA.1